MPSKIGSSQQSYTHCLSADRSCVGYNNLLLLYPTFSAAQEAGHASPRRDQPNRSPCRSSEMIFSGCSFRATSSGCFEVYDVGYNKVQPRASRVRSAHVSSTPHKKMLGKQSRQVTQRDLQCSSGRSLDAWPTAAANLWRVYNVDAHRREAEQRQTRLSTWQYESAQS
jgi:hypothetical protein